MNTIPLSFAPNRNKFYARAAALVLIAIFYNIGEGLVSVFFGVEDESFTLFGFGLDSFVEVASGIGIWYMIGRIRQNEGRTPTVSRRLRSGLPAGDSMS